MSARTVGIVEGYRAFLVSEEALERIREKWVMRDSNPRHLPCKGSALTN